MSSDRARPQPQSQVSKLFDWLTVADAALYLSRALGEDVRESEVIRLGVDGRLQLSVRFANQAWARTCDPSERELTVDDVGDLGIDWAQFEPTVIDGVWDLIAHAGSGAIELERRFQQLTDGHEVTLWGAGGIYLARPDRSEWAVLVMFVVNGVKVFPDIVANGLPMVKVEKSYPALHELPADASLVVRAEVLEGFLRGVRLARNEPSRSSEISTDAAPSARPLQAQRAQEEAILGKLKELGFDPLALPAPAPGKASEAKSAVRIGLSYSTAVMNKAWLRLRADGTIRDAPP